MKGLLWNAVLLSIPASALAQLPQVSATTPSESNLPPVVDSAPVSAFPALPPSRPCVANDIDGLWKMVQVFESPAGSHLMRFTSYPHQYVFFKPNAVYANLELMTPPESAQKVADDLLDAPNEPLRQYVLGERGFLYSYVSGAVSDTQVCFIVANATDRFTAGHMLLMPPADRGRTSRLVKVYERMNVALPTPVTQPLSSGVSTTGQQPSTSYMPQRQPPSVPLQPTQYPAFQPPSTYRQPDSTARAIPRPRTGEAATSLGINELPNFQQNYNTVPVPPSRPRDVQ